MATILRTLGGGFRLIGPLTVANAFSNPSFEAGTTGWVATDPRVTLTAATDQFYFGTQSCRVDIATGQVNGYCGLAQTISAEVVPGQDATLGAWILIPSQLPAPLQATLTFLDQNGAAIAVHTSELSLGVASGWSHVAFTETSVPLGTFSATIGLMIYTAAAATFYVDGMIWSVGDTNSYVDGDYANYVWAGDRWNSMTLLSAAPDTLSFFQTDAQTVTPVPVVA